MKKVSQDRPFRNYVVQIPLLWYIIIVLQYLVTDQALMCLSIYVHTHIYNYFNLQIRVNQKMAHVPLIQK